MAGIYIHIPFCKSRCTYCAFYSTTGLEKRRQYVDAVCREMELRQTWSDEPVATVYLGGGTPSQLTAAQLSQLFGCLYNIYKVSDDAEVTIEVNPDDVTDELAAALAGLPVNRVSMGAQTFCDRRLRFLNRRHTSAQVADAVGRLRRAGIGNVSIDLMYGFPGETLDEWQDDITAVLTLGADHLSAYCLTVEQGTALYETMSRDGGVSEDEELQRQMYYTLIDRLALAGYEHYEISNFARPGCRSRHNSGYWTDRPYLGLGAAAHSYDGHRRWWNVGDIDDYMRSTALSATACESETIDGDTRYNDRVMLALRTADGLDTDDLTAADRSYLLALARKHVDSGLLTLSGGCLKLTREGLFVSDLVVSDLMRV